MSRSPLLENRLREAADYFQVWKRPFPGEGPEQIKINFGCYSCKHKQSKPLRVSHNLRTAWLHGIGVDTKKGPIVNPVGAIVVDINDNDFVKTFNTSNNELALHTYNTTKKFPFNGNMYYGGKQVKAFGPIHVELAYKNGEIKHLNKPINIYEYFFEETYPTFFDMTAIIQGRWGPGVYGDPTKSPKNNLGPTTESDLSSMIIRNEDRAAELNALLTGSTNGMVQVKPLATKTKPSWGKSKPAPKKGAIFYDINGEGLTSITDAGDL